MPRETIGRVPCSKPGAGYQRRIREGFSALVVALTDRPTDMVQHLFFRRASTARGSFCRRRLAPRSRGHHETARRECRYQCRLLSWQGLLRWRSKPAPTMLCFYRC